MSCQHHSTYERGRIEVLSKPGYSNRVITRCLGRHRSCIDRETKRNAAREEYKAEVAQKRYQQRRQCSGPKNKWNEGLANCIQQEQLIRVGHDWAIDVP